MQYSILSLTDTGGTTWVPPIDRTRGVIILITLTGLGLGMLVIALSALGAIATHSGNDDHRRSSSSPN